MRKLETIKPAPLEVRTVPAKIYHIGPARKFTDRPPAQYTNESHDEMLKRILGDEFYDCIYDKKFNL